MSSPTLLPGVLWVAAGLLLAIGGWLVYAGIVAKRRHAIAGWSCADFSLGAQAAGLILLLDYRQQLVRRRFTKEKTDVQATGFALDRVCGRDPGFSRVRAGSGSSAGTRPWSTRAVRQHGAGRHHL